MGSVSVRWIYLRPINLGQSEHTYVSYSYWTSEPAAYPVRLWRTLQYRYYIYGTLRDGSGEHQVFHHEREPRASRINTPVCAVTAGGRTFPAHGPRIGGKLGKNWETGEKGNKWQHTGPERDGDGQARLL